MKILLKEFIKLIIESGEEKHLRTSSDISEDEFVDKESFIIMKKIMSEFNVNLVPRGNSQIGFLGEGHFGRVYEIIKNGKHMAMKVTDSSVDYRSYKQCASVRQSLPKHLASHLPLVYDQGKLQVDTGEDEKTIYVTFMELLVPLHDANALDMWGNVDKTSPTHNSVVSATLKDIKGMMPGIIVLSINSTGKGDISKGDIDNDIITNIMKGVKGVLDSLEEYSGVNASEISYMLKSAFLQRLQSSSLILGLSRSDLDDASDSFAEIVIGKIPFINPSKDNPRNRMPFDRRFEQGNDVSFKDKRAQALFDALDEMHHGKFMKWNDVKAANVMVRPLTGEYVLADVGIAFD